MNPHAMTPDELLSWAMGPHSSIVHPITTAIIHLHGEYARLKARCAELMTRYVEHERLREDLSIANGHVDAYRKENERLRGLLDAKTTAPWGKRDGS